MGWLSPDLHLDGAGLESTAPLDVTVGTSAPVIDTRERYGAQDGVEGAGATWTERFPDAIAETSAD